MISAKELINEFIDAQNHNELTIGVVGDIILDEYYDVTVNRISQEFPVPVMTSSNSKPVNVMPGGAALTAWHLSPFNIKTNLFGCADGEALPYLNKHFQFTQANNNTITPRKRRFYDQGFAGPRWDIEDCRDFNTAEWTQARERLLDQIEQYLDLDEPDMMILSDYEKGLFYDNFAQDVIELCNSFDVPTLVDPKNPPIEQWKNCTIFKPNLKEANNFTNCLNELTELTNCKAAVITAGGDGVYTYPKNKPHSYYRMPHSISGHPLGYSGAGDCFAAIYAAAYCSNFNFRESSIIANHIASIYVQHPYNNPVSLHQIRQHVEPIKSKIFNNADDLKKTIESHKGKIVMANGCFDLIHFGHTRLLQFAKEQGDILIVAIDDDKNVKRLKGNNRPIYTLSERMEIVASMECVDYVISFSETPDQLIKKLPHIDVLIKGNNYSADGIIGADLVGEVALYPLRDKISTTNTIKKIINNGQDYCASSRRRTKDW